MSNITGTVESYLGPIDITEQLIKKYKKTGITDVEDIENKELERLVRNWWSTYIPRAILNIEDEKVRRESIRELKNAIKDVISTSQRNNDLKVVSRLDKFFPATSFSKLYQDILYNKGQQKTYKKSPTFFRILARFAKQRLGVDLLNDQQTTQRLSVQQFERGLNQYAKLYKTVGQYVKQRAVSTKSVLPAKSSLPPMKPMKSVFSVKSTVSKSQ